MKHPVVDCGNANCKLRNQVKGHQVKGPATKAISFTTLVNGTCDLTGFLVTSKGLESLANFGKPNFKSTGQQ
jgi:hypothetical protein